MPVIYQFPYDSPVRYLPLAYMLPYDVLSRYPTLSKLPRSMGALNASPEWGKIIVSQQFLNEIMDAVASLAFPHFGFSGWKEHYTGYSPVWRLSYALPLWAKGVEKLRGWGIQALFALPPDYEIPFYDPEDVRQVMKQVVEQTIEEQGWGPMLEVIRDMPCDEDFEKWDTNVRKDFLRKWYHTRSKRVQTVSLEECMEDEDSNIHSLPDPKGDFTEQVESEDFCQRFKAPPIPKGYGNFGSAGGGIHTGRNCRQAGVQDPQCRDQADGGNQEAIYSIRTGIRAIKPRNPNRVSVAFFCPHDCKGGGYHAGHSGGHRGPKPGRTAPYWDGASHSPDGENIGHRRQNGRKITVCNSTIYQTQGGTGRCSGSTPRAPEGTVRQQSGH